jgi:predicted nucleotidyltransferase
MTAMLDRLRSFRQWDADAGPPGDYDSPMSETTDNLITEAGRRLAAAAPGSEVILFGSHARGEASGHSDVDFLVVEPDVENEAEESVRLRRVLRDLRLPADVVVVSRDYAERWREVRGGLVHAALSQGKVLVGR